MNTYVHEFYQNLFNSLGKDRLQISMFKIANGGHIGNPIKYKILHAYYIKHKVQHALLGQIFIMSTKHLTHSMIWWLNTFNDKYQNRK